MYNFKEFEKQALKAFRARYTAYKDVKKKDISICEDGFIQIGAMQFPINVKLTNYKS